MIGVGVGDGVQPQCHPPVPTAPGLPDLAGADVDHRIPNWVFLGDLMANLDPNRYGDGRASPAATSRGTYDPLGQLGGATSPASTCS